jgi:hypothetical protein
MAVFSRSLNFIKTFIKHLFRIGYNNFPSILLVSLFRGKNYPKNAHKSLFSTSFLATKIKDLRTFLTSLLLYFLTSFSAITLYFFHLVKPPILAFAESIGGGFTFFWLFITL